MITAKNHYTPFLFCLTWLFVTGSVDAAELSTAKAADVSDSNTIDKTEWTMGVGLGVFDYHLYPGAKKTNRLILPVPYFIFSSPKFEVGSGKKSFLYNSKTFVIDISADFGLPVDSDDTEARQGMPDLDFTLQFGPSVELLLNDKNTNYFDTRFEVPVRVAYAIGVSGVEQTGYLVEPRISFNHRRSARTGLSHKGIIGIKFATQDYHAYYYDVAAEFSDTLRPEYRSDAGYGGSFAKYRLSYKTSNFVYWTFMRYQSLRGSVFEESPLVLKKDYYLIGVGFSWIFAQSF